eukprot:CAMPEP_0115871812 /NCGR_PEP_ID=MMETSP0287-20121206/23084_1 /TAXON_ID=412157 /ORGANISM="Chrysochromulina rotalis, Strain UIO044" /LENGTH=57 /DNA_ID=CAMNT_0003326675 /DNA_START=382 /DNA_END=555 /DNA_ORIENTATION=+
MGALEAHRLQGALRAQPPHRHWMPSGPQMLGASQQGSRTGTIHHYSMRDALSDLDVS